MEIAWPSESGGNVERSGEQGQVDREAWKTKQKDLYFWLEQPGAMAERGARGVEMRSGRGIGGTQ